MRRENLLPLPPLEASGTSGMKAAFNGVPSLSVLDGWWIEGCIENVTGWSVDGAATLYEKLSNTVLPLLGFGRRFDCDRQCATRLGCSGAH